MRQLKGKVAFITGASSGIGRQLAQDLARAGMRLALVARSADRLAETAGGCPPGTETLCLRCDVSVRGEVEKAAAEALARFGRVDLLVNDAGQCRYHSFLDADVDEFERLMRVNYLGMIYCAKALLPGMVERREGHVVNVSSVAGRVGTPSLTAYSATKFAITGFSESLYYELRGSGVGLTVVNPGIVDTNLWADESCRNLPRSLLAMAIPPKRVSSAIIQAVRADRFEITVPASLWASVIFKTLAPPAFRLSQAIYLGRLK